MEKALGIVRHLDNLGRIVVPVELRRRLGMMGRAEAELYLDGTDVKIRAWNKEDSSVGVVREFDGLGRIVIPAETRRIFGWEPGEALAFFTNEDSEVVLRSYKATVACVICGTIESTPGEFMNVRGKLVCPTDAALIAKHVM